MAEGLQFCFSKEISLPSTKQFPVLNAHITWLLEFILIITAIIWLNLLKSYYQPFSLQSAITVIIFWFSTATLTRATTECDKKSRIIKPKNYRRGKYLKGTIRKPNNDAQSCLDGGILGQRVFIRKINAGKRSMLSYIHVGFLIQGNRSNTIERPH